jgi:hypothetical protein
MLPTERPNLSSSCELGIITNLLLLAPTTAHYNNIYTRKRSWGQHKNYFFGGNIAPAALRHHRF